MSNIPKSKRQKSDLQVMHLCYQIRSRITTELMQTFGYSEKHLEAHIKRTTSYIRATDEREEAQSRMREMNAHFSMWFIEHERSRILDWTQDIAIHIRSANTIWPTSWAEYDERRLEWTRAMVSCNRLQDELQYIAEALPSDKNRYTQIVLDIETMFKMIHALKKADSKFKKSLPARGNAGSNGPSDT